MSHILVPTDFSETARAALEFAVEMAQHCQGRITLLHVIFAAKVEEQLEGLDAMRYLSATRDKLSEEWKRVAGAKLAEAAATVTADIPVEVALETGRPSTAIVEYARAHAVDMIAMGTHGRGPVARFFIGSVTENVIRSADCPVTVVRHAKRG
jgi:nucleotide-binding universal stress UspA family protein